MRRFTIAFAAAAASLNANTAVSVLIADKGALVAAETVHPAPRPPAASAEAVTSVGDVQVQEPIALPGPKPVQSEPVPEPAPAAAAAAPVEHEATTDPLPDNVKVEQPDSGGVIVLTPKQKVGNTPNPEVISRHNPWGVRVVTKDTLLSFTLRLDGIIVGPQSTAMINSSPVRKGETKTGPFTLYRIRKQEVLMEYDGAVFALPLGRTVTVRIPKL